MYCLFLNVETMELSPEQKQFVIRHQHENVRDLALRFSRKDLPFLLAQIKGRQIAKRKFPSWQDNDNLLYPPSLSIEQASSEQTARFKQSLLPNGKESFADLTGGLGVDFYFLSRSFKHAIYVEQSQELCKIAQHNFDVLGVENVTIKNMQSEDFLTQTEKIDVIFVDPARRNNDGRKVFKIEDCSPDMSQLQTELAEKSDFVMIKYSPLLDISLAVKTLEHVRDVYVVSVENECKELLFLLSPSEMEGQIQLSACKYHAINIKKNDCIESFSFCPEKERNVEIEYASQLDSYLYEPNSSVLKAGGFNSIAHAFSLKKLHKNSHLYTSNKLVNGFPGRIFKVIDSFIPSKNNTKTFLSKTKSATINVRNFPMSVEEIRKKTRLKEGGDVYLFATTLSNERKVWVIGLPDSPPLLPPHSPHRHHKPLDQSQVFCNHIGNAQQLLCDGQGDAKIGQHAVGKVNLYDKKTFVSGNT